MHGRPRARAARALAARTSGYTGRVHARAQHAALALPHLSARL